MVPGTILHDNAVPAGIDHVRIIRKWKTRVNSTPFFTYYTRWIIFIIRRLLDALVGGGSTSVNSLFALSPVRILYCNKLIEIHQ